MLGGDPQAMGVGGGASVRPHFLALVLGLVGVFLLQMLVPPFQGFAMSYLAMDTAAFLGQLRLWQPVTAIFLHADLMHIGMNVLFLWVFGAALAAEWRVREFLTFFLACGAAGSVCFWLWHAISGGEPVRGLGASGAVFGLMAAFAMAFGERTMLLLFIIPMKAKHLVAMCVVLELILLVRGQPDGVAHVAHLGGALAGWAIVKVVWRQQSRLAGETGGRKAPVTSRFDSLDVMAS